VRRDHVATCCVLRGADCLIRFERMPFSDNAEVAVTEQCLHAYLGAHFLHDTDLEIR